ncbi:susD family protein [Prevotella sp. CAG:1124]|nr:susD family protein [Prevotella sp. CAG:1124]
MMSDTWKSQNLVATAKQGYGINPVKLRYSQVLLYYAEVMNELAGSPDARYDGDAGITAREALAQVHNRAFDSADLTEAQAYINNISSDKDSFFDAIVQENAWELAGEGMRKWDLIRWNLLVPKIKESSDSAKTQIDMSSITWYTDPADITASDYDGSESSYGSSDITDTNDTQVYTNLPSISSGLVGSSIESLGISGTEPSVVNRYLMPIGSTTISASNGTLQNSYGYTN